MHPTPTPSGSFLTRLLSALRLACGQAVAPVASSRQSRSRTSRHRWHRVLGLTALVACAGTAPAGTLYLSRLSGANENPANSSTFSGLGVLILNDTDTAATITATHDISIPVTGGHIHRAPSTTNGPVIFPFPAPASPVGPLTWNIPSGDVSNLKNLGLYMNFHTATNPGGVIRGQLVRALLAPAATTAAQTRLANVLDISAGYDTDLNQILIQTNMASLAMQAQTLNDLTARTVYSPVRQEIEAMATLTGSMFAHAEDVRYHGGVSAPGQFSTFFQAGSDFGKRSATVNQEGASISRPFALAGVDYRFTENTRGGLAVGYANGQDKFEAGLGRSRTKLTTLQAFASTQLGDSGMVLDAALGYGSGKVSSSRNIPSLARTALASTDGSAWSTALKASKSLTLSNQSILIPYLLYDVQVVSVDGYSESGAGAAGLVVPERKSWNSSLEGGVTLLIPFKRQSGGKLTARLQAGYHHMIEDGAGNISTRLVGSPLPFGTVIEGQGKGAAHLEAALIATSANGMVSTLGYRGLLGGKGRKIHALEARIAFKL